MLLHTSFLGLTFLTQPTPKPTVATVKGASKPVAKTVPRATKEAMNDSFNQIFKD